MSVVTVHEAGAAVVVADLDLAAAESIAGTFNETHAGSAVATATDISDA